MDKKTTGIVGYITLIGWIVAMCAGDREGAKFHLNQSLGICIVSVVGEAVGGIICKIGGLIPVVGIVLVIIGSLLSAAVGIFCFVCMIMGVVNASNDEEKELPLVSMFNLLK